MPIYEYRCRKCGKKSTYVTLSVKAALEPACRSCGSRDVVKLVSRVSISRSEESRMESLADPSKLSGVDENDPKSLARWMRKMSSEVGEEMPEEFDEVIGRLESGQTPEEIEESMPELGESPGGGMDDFE